MESPKTNSKEVPLIFRLIAGAPLLWFMIIPIIISDIFIEIYQRIFFPLHGIKIVNRNHYIKIWDRAKLPYLKWYEKIGCAYCGYANGWLHFASVIAAKTERYYCAIAHLEERGYIPTAHEKTFAKYGDADAYLRRYEESS